MANVLVDTDIFVDHLRGAHELRAGKHRLAYSVITRAELFASTTATDAVSKVLAPFREFAVDRAVAERAGAPVTLLPPVHPGEVLVEEFLGPVELSQYRPASARS